MKRILIDSGPIIALFDASDRFHNASVAFVRSNTYPLVTTLASITEALHLLDFSRDAQLDLLEWIIRGGVEIHPIHNSDVRRLKELTEKYRDLPMDFADSCLVYLAEQLHIDTVATIDRDFTVYRIDGKKPFNILIS